MSYVAQTSTGRHDRVSKFTRSPSNPRADMETTVTVEPVQVDQVDLAFANQLSFDELDGLGGLEIISHDLIDDDHKDLLLGVPHIITRCVWRPSDYNDDYDMISCEAVIASEQKLARAVQMGRIVHAPTMEQLSPVIEPGARIVYNDGSTGIRNQINAMLHATGAIEFPGGDDQSRWSAGHTQWIGYNTDCIDIVVKRDESTYAVSKALPGGRPFIIKVGGGLRVSRFGWDDKAKQVVDGDTQRTYYLQ